jgi:hypothetical protein
MKRPGPSSARQVALAIRKALDRGQTVEIDGLGTFRPRAGGAFFFDPNNAPRVFVAYAMEDGVMALRLYQAFEAAGYQPWLDREKLMPGQNWPRSIERAIEVADFFVPCFSRRSAIKRGAFHAELRWALECATRVPLDDIFILPVRLEPCHIPKLLTRSVQYLDLFPDWGKGVARLMRTIDDETARRRRLPLAS